MAEEYLSTDPNAGLEDQYISTDPNAGLEQKSEGGVGAGVLSAVGHALNPINIVKGALGLGQPSDISQIMRYGKTLGEIVSGTSPDEAIGRNIPELQHEREAFYGKLGTKEQAQEMAGLGIQAALLAAPFIHGKVLPRAPGSLSEVAGIKPVTPEAMPQTPEPLVSEVAAQETQPIPKPVEEVIPSATEIRQEPESSIIEHPPVEEGALPAETSGSNRPVESGEIPQEVAEPVPQPEPTTFNVTFGKDVFGQSETPVSSYVMDSGGILSKSGARKAGRFEGNEALWDDPPSLKHPTHNKVYKTTGEMPDNMAQNLYDNGLISEPTTGAMYRAIESESKTSREAVRNAQPVNPVKQAESFGKEQRKEQKSGTEPIPASDLNVGDLVTVGGEELRVKDVSPDDFSVTLEDGRQFGVQEVSGDDVIYGEHKPAPASEEFAPVESPPVPTEPTKGTGVSSERFTEQYGEDAPVPNTGKSAGQLKEIGVSRLDNFQKTGDVRDDPYSVLTNLREGKVPVSQLADDVSLLRAEHQRLKNEARNAEGTPEWEDKKQTALGMANAIKEVAHGPASDMMRSFQEYDVPRYDNVTDFDMAWQERLGRESTSQERVQFKKMAEDVTSTRNGAEEAINGVQKRLNKMPKMDFAEAAKNIQDQITELTKDCVI